METITFIGLDAHKKTIAVALAKDGRDGEVRSLGTIENSAVAVERLARRLSAAHGRLRFSYEAGPCGYGLWRQLRRLGHDCVVAAPALIARRPGDRVKTDRRDALKLARQDRAGELVEVCVPDAAHEAMRDLVRARQAAVKELGAARQQLQSFLLRQGVVWTGRSRWTKAHRAWLERLALEHPAHRIVLTESLAAIAAAEARRDRLTRAVAELVPSWSAAPVLAALQAARGIALINAATIVAEIGGFRRFDSARQIMAFVGLGICERSSGERQRRFGITKAGNARVRRALDEAAWCYARAPRPSAALARRRAGQPPAIRAIAEAAERRLPARFRHLRQHGKPAPVAVTAIARELIGFLWAIGCAVETAGDQPRR